MRLLVILSLCYVGLQAQPNIPKLPGIPNVPALIQEKEKIDNKPQKKIKQEIPPLAPLPESKPAPIIIYGPPEPKPEPAPIIIYGPPAPPAPSVTDIIVPAAIDDIKAIKEINTVEIKETISKKIFIVFLSLIGLIAISSIVMSALSIRPSS